MAGERTLPGLGLTAFWDLGDDTWKAGMDANIRVLSALVQPRCISVAATEPGSPTNGDIYLSSGTWGLGSANDIMLRDNGAWVVVTPVEGWHIYNIATDQDLQFNGTAWVDTSALAATSMLLVTDDAANRILSNSDLSGRVVLRRTSASAQTVTVNPGLTGTGPVTVSKAGAGDLTFVAGSGVTILSADGNLAIETLHGAATLIPLGSNTYQLVGLLA